MTYSETVEFLYDLQFFGIKLGLENTLAFLNFTNCQKPTADMIHIAGTNGKGSTATMLAKIGRNHGKQVGLYTSPHILDFRERIQVNDRLISEEWIVSFIESNISFITTHKLTFFEATTVMAIAYFESCNVDLIILETGMGGRLDATNCFIPKACIITNVSLDHQSYLGDNLDSIIMEKSGIIKSKVPLICASESIQVLGKIKSKCEKLNAPFIQVSDVSDDFFLFKEEKYHTNLLGKHQQLNAKTALKAYSLLYETNSKATKSALSSIVWKGRLEVWEKYSNVYLDVSHNPAGVKETVKTLKKIDPEQKYIIVFAFLDDKDTTGNLSLLNEITEKLYFYEFENERLQNGLLHSQKFQIELFGKIPIKEFILKFRSKKILVIGSHYLIESILKRSQVD